MKETFGQRFSRLRKKYDLDIIEKVLNKYGFDLSVRAEDLKLEIFVQISNRLVS